MLVPQIAGCLSASRTWAYKAFNDVCTGIRYGYMMRNASLEQTTQAKISFEVELAKHDVKVKSCRADNGRFADKCFRYEVQNCNHVITCCSVGAHHQNGSV